MTSQKEYQMEPGPGRESIAQAETTQQAEVGRSIQDILQRTKKTAGAMMKTVADRRYAGVIDDLESLIHRYPFPAFLIGSSLGFLLSRSWRRSRTDLQEK